MSDVIHAVEGEACWLVGATTHDLPSDLPSDVSVLSRSSEIGLRFDGLVGTVQLRNGKQVQVDPKIGPANFLDLVSYAHGGTPLVERTSGSFSYSLGGRSGFAELVGPQFVKSLDRLIRTSLNSERVWRNGQISEFTGQVNRVATARRVAQKVSRPVVTRSRIRSHDTPEHRLFGVALRVLKPSLPPSERETSLSLMKRLPSSGREFETLKTDLETVKTRLLTNSYRGLRSYYSETVGLLLVVLNVTGLGGSGQNSVAGSTFLIRTATVFEQFVRRSVQEELKGQGFVVTKGGTFRRFLYADGSYSLEPDVVIEKDGRCLLVLDAKYKEPSISDHYQMLAYLERFEVDRGVLVSLSTNSVDELRTFATVSNRQVDIRSHNLMNMDQAIQSIVGYLKEIC